MGRIVTKPREKCVTWSYVIGLLSFGLGSTLTGMSFTNYFMDQTQTSDLIENTFNYNFVD